MICKNLISWVINVVKLKLMEQQFDTVLLIFGDNFLKSQPSYKISSISITTKKISLIDQIHNFHKKIPNAKLLSLAVGDLGCW